MAGYATGLCQETVRRLSIKPSSFLAPVHGDVHFNQVLFAGDSIRLLDFDRACLSNPMEDLGRFYAELILAEPQSGRVQSTDDLLGELLQAYVESGGIIDMEWIELFAACRFWEIVCEPFRYRFTDWPSEVERRLRLIEEVLKRQPGTGHFIEQARGTDHASSYAAAVILQDPFRLAEDRQLIPQNDPIDPTVARQLFTRLESADGRHAGIELQSIHVRRHKRGRRCLIEYSGNSLTTGDKIALLGKVDSKARHRRYFEQQCRLWDAGFNEQSGDRICVARPWAVVHEWNMWLQQKADGADCWNALRGSQGCVVARRIAQALYKLHSSNVRTLRPHSLNNELEILDDRLRAAAVDAPILAEKIGLLRQSCQNAAQELPATADVPIHRDFYPDQVIVGRENVVLVDFDLLSAGNPTIDVGNFCGHLIEHSLRTCRHPFSYSEQEEAFVREYCRLSSEVTPNAISFFTFASLARHVYLCLTIPGRRGNANRALDFASELLAKSNRVCT
jgi:aminoglycoside phosphotransferase (APT) family kinase protein